VPRRPRGRICTKFGTGVVVVTNFWRSVKGVEFVGDQKSVVPIDKACRR